MMVLFNIKTYENTGDNFFLYGCPLSLMKPLRDAEIVIPYNLFYCFEQNFGTGNLSHKNKTAVRCTTVFFGAEDGTWSRRAIAPQSFAVLTVHRTVIHYRSYFESLYCCAKKQRT